MSMVLRASNLVEIWAIKVTDDTDGDYYLPPIDDMECGEFMAFPSQEKAAEAIEHQMDRGYLDEDQNAVPVRLK